MYFYIRFVAVLPFVPAGGIRIPISGGKSLNNTEVGRFEFHGGGENADGEHG
jgi:hypothetical protein